MPDAPITPDGQPYSVEDYRDALLASLPSGPVWPREPGAVLPTVAAALAPTFQRLDASALALLQDAPAGRALLGQLPDWEATLGLPDPCAGDDPTIEQRRLSVRAQIAMRGGQSIPYFVEVAAALGVAVTVDEFVPLRFGDGFGGEFGSDDWSHTWRVTVPALTRTYFEFGTGYFGEGFSEWGSEVLECTLRRIAPAHTVLLIAYTGEAGAALWDTQGGWDKGGWA